MRLIALGIMAVVLLAGCENAAPPSGSQSGKVALTPPVPPPPVPPKAEPATAASSQVVKKQTTERVKAEVGVGKRVRRLDNPELVRMIVQPARTLFRTRERVIFEIQIPKALQLYEATQGRGPKTHEEFMRKVIKANDIQLPQLPAGQRYVYDPKQKQLMVEKPAR